MAQHRSGLDRRRFLQSAGMTALWGAVGTGASVGATGVAAAAQAGRTTYDFDTIYNRFGTNSTKFDRAIRVYGKGAIEVGMGQQGLKQGGGPG